MAVSDIRARTKVKIPLRFYQYLLDCPMSDVRASFAFIIVTLAKLSAPDPLLSLSELNAWTADGFVSYHYIFFLV